MQDTGGSIAYEDDGMQREKILFTYSEEEKQKNEINEANAKLVFSPEFIPYYMAEKKEYGLTHSETILYGFIRFYTTNASGRFYFTNEQLAEICDCSVPSVSRSIKKLEDAGIIKVSRKMKAGGGQIRFISSNLSKGLVATNQNHRTNKNKIKENKNNNNYLSLNDFIQSRNKVKKIGTRKGFKQCTVVNDDIKYVWNKVTKKYTKEQIVLGVKNYANDIATRPVSNGYENHRFSLYEFLKQKNGLTTFINK